MSKSILVIDTPKSCSECEFKNCKVRNTIYDRMRAPQCPLQPTDELLEIVSDYYGEGDMTDEDYNKLYKALGGKDE